MGQAYDNIYIVWGPIFFKSQEHKQIGSHQIPVPEAFYYIQLKFAYDYWKQYEAEWNKKYKKYIEYERSKTT